MASQGDWYLCEGLLSVFINANHSKQKVVYKKQKVTSTPNQRSCSTATNQQVLLDFGSCKETISFYNESELRKTNEAAGCGDGSSSPNGSIQIKDSADYDTRKVHMDPYAAQHVVGSYYHGGAQIYQSQRAFK